MDFWTFMSLVVLLGFAKTFLRHRQKMAEIGGQGGQQAGTVAGEVRELRAQLAELRDTTTRYDLSFDTALQRLEHRMARVEQRAAQPEREAQTVEPR
jgi:hypothetical protein